MRSVVTIGVFDGVHLGHRKIISQVVERARKLKSKSIVVTFNPHPLKALNPKYNIPSLISLTHRIRLIEELGADHVIVLNFTRAISRLSPEDFVRKILIKRLGAREIIVGENFRFGKGANAGAKALKEIGERMGIKVSTIRSVKKHERIVSSSYIRQLVVTGRLRQAASLLGRPVSVLGTVVSGSRFARVLGYPTANINPHHEAIPPFGVYVIKAKFLGKFYKGMLNIGTRPTFFSPRDKEPNIEAHLFGFNKLIYGKELEVLFVRKLRDERKFANRADLIRQIRKDAAAARKNFA